MGFAVVELFPFSEYWWFYLVFFVFIGFVLLLDLGLFNRKEHEISVKEAAIWSVVFVSIALLFNLLLYFYCLWKFPLDPRLMAIPGFEPEAAAYKTALEFLSGLFVEKALAVDNIFVFIIIFNFLGIPKIYHHRVLFYGIIGALVFRAIFIALGSILMSYFFVVVIFGIFLIYTGIKMIVIKEGSDAKPEDNRVIRLLRRFLPIYPQLVGSKLFHRVDGRLFATPLFVCIVMLEFSDIIFALDSVPAIFGLTHEPFIVYTSNVFAILGLRALFFLIIGIIGRVHYLKTGVALVLIFVGSKMSFLHYVMTEPFPISWSLLIITLLIGGSVLASFLFPPRHSSTKQ